MSTFYWTNIADHCVAKIHESAAQAASFKIDPNGCRSKEKTNFCALNTMMVSNLPCLSNFCRKNDFVVVTFFFCLTGPNYLSLSYMDSWTTTTTHGVKGWEACRRWCWWWLKRGNVQSLGMDTVRHGGSSFRSSKRDWTKLRQKYLIRSKPSYLDIQWINLIIEWWSPFCPFCNISVESLDPQPPPPPCPYGCNNSLIRYKAFLDILWIK